jgi:DNA-binding transcriptional MocR family regulator
MPGDIFYENMQNTSKFITGNDTFRIGFGRVTDEDIEKGIKIIGKNIRLLTKD